MNNDEIIIDRKVMQDILILLEANSWISISSPGLEERKKNRLTCLNILMKSMNVSESYVKELHAENINHLEEIRNKYIIKE